MPNMIAYAALIIWPIVTVILFVQMSPRKAIIWSLLAGYLLLPLGAKFDPPLVPNLDKTTIPNIATFLCALLFGHRLVRLPKSPVVLALMAAFIVVPLFTGLNNRQPIILVDTALPGMSWYDSVSTAVYHAITLLPFVLGYSALSREADHRDLLKILAIAMVAYSIPILYEIRFSPVLHGRIYGSATGQFFQSIRGGGFRASVFIGHGLLVATICAMGLLAALTLWRMKLRVLTVPAGLVAAWLALVLLLNKSAGSILLAGLATPFLLFVRPRRAVGIMAVLAAVILTYPMVRASNLFPTQTISEMAGAISSERQASLDFRFDNESRLLDRAKEKPVFGWGTWDRNQIYSATGWGGINRETTPDGTWIITVGQFGWTGYLAVFGLLCYPFYRAFRQRGKEIPIAAMGLLTLHLVNLLDLIPNSSLRPITWLIAGALSGVVFSARQRRASGDAPLPAPAPGRRSPMPAA